MFNFIYSILKRCSLNKDNSLNGRNFYRVVIIFILIYIFIPITYLFGTLEKSIENLSSTTKIFIDIIIGFICLYPFFRIIHPGYKYLDKVKNYDTDTAYIYLMLLFLPALLCYLIPNL